MVSARRVLVVANRTADCPELRQALLARHTDGAIAVTLVVPAVWEVVDPHGGRESALRRMRAAKKHLQDDGIDVSCVLGDPDPMTAFEREWKRGGYDEVVVSTLPSQLSRWLHVDLPRRIQRAVAGVPMTHVVGSATDEADLAGR
jgi:hypothetical protein